MMIETGYDVSNVLDYFQGYKLIDICWFVSDLESIDLVKGSMDDIESDYYGYLSNEFGWKGCRNAFSDYFYHGINDDVLSSFMKNGFIFNEYYNGFWITTKKYTASKFGNNVLELPKDILNIENMEITPADDGILYKGKVNYSDDYLIDVK